MRLFFCALFLFLIALDVGDITMRIERLEGAVLKMERAQTGKAP